MSPSPPVILYRYDASPYSHKVDNILILKGIPHLRVNVATALPRPEITDVLGIAYRRIPILAIGNDIYCDTNLIASVLERRFRPSAGYGTILPLAKHGGSCDTGLIKAFSKYYGETLFTLAPLLLPWEKFPASFIKDRNDFFASPLNVNAIVARRPQIISNLASHLVLIEEQLSDDREWLFDTELPSLADLSVHFILAWVKGFRGVETLFDENQFPKTLKWLARTSAFLAKKKAGQETPQKISGAQAAEIIASSSHESLPAIGFDSVEAGRLCLKKDDQVRVAPEDTARTFATVGNLLALNKEEVVIEVKGEKGILHCHFPRLGFSVHSVNKGKL